MKILHEISVNFYLGVFLFLTFGKENLGVLSSSLIHVEQQLRRDLFSNYDKSLRPANDNQAINISIGLEINHVEFDESKAVVTVFGQLLARWQDLKLHWNPSDYDNLKSLHLNGHEVWIPDLSLYNSAVNNVLDYYENGVCWVEFDGNVTWAVRVRLQAFCEMDLKHWPFDSHICELILGSWTYHGYHVDLFPQGPLPSKKTLTENSEFIIKNSSSVRISTLYSCCEEPYISINYNLELKRRSSGFHIIFFTPASCIVVLSLLAFWIPPNRGEKVLLNGINLFINLIFLLYFARNLPVFAFSIPLLAIFYSTTFVFISFSILISVMVITIARSKSINPMPPGFQKLIKGRIGDILGVSNGSNQKQQTELRQHFEDGKSNDDRSLIQKDLGAGDWVLLATAIDRICFIVYCFAFLTIAILCF